MLQLLKFLLMNYRFILISIICIFLSGCMGADNYAPVMDVGHIEAIPKKGLHRVTQGETMYEIAWRYGLDYRYLAKRNHIMPPYTIRVGQVIYLRGYAHSRVTQIAHQPTQLSLAKVQPEEKEPDYLSSGWMWPAQGRVVHTFSAMNKGVDIANQLGSPIYAAAAGKVVYSGSGLRGYGNLLIIKHNHIYLSAYAHNSVILVKEGDRVKKGQKIAEMGDTGSNRVMLHFEIRREGKPVNPLSIFKI